MTVSAARLASWRDGLWWGGCLPGWRLIPIWLALPVRARRKVYYRSPLLWRLSLRCIVLEVTYSPPACLPAELSSDDLNTQLLLLAPCVLLTLAADGVIRIWRFTHPAPLPSWAHTVSTTLSTLPAPLHLHAHTGSSGSNSAAASGPVSLERGDSGHAHSSSKFSLQFARSGHHSKHASASSTSGSEHGDSGRTGAAGVDPAGPDISSVASGVWYINSELSMPMHASARDVHPGAAGRAGSNHRPHGHMHARQTNDHTWSSTGSAGVSPSGSGSAAPSPTESPRSVQSDAEAPQDRQVPRRYIGCAWVDPVNISLEGSWRSHPHPPLMCMV